MENTDNPEMNLIQTYGDHGLRFAGPDLLDYSMIFEISGGVYDGERLRVEKSYHPWCGTLEVNVSLFNIYKRWWNKLDGCKQHQRDEGGERGIRGYIWEINLIVR